MSRLESVVSQTPNTDLLSTPQFVREREAWYKAGAANMAGRAAMAVVVAGIIAGLASLIFDIGPYKVATLIVIGACGGIAILSLLVAINARNIARRGGVEIDRF